MFDKLKLIHQGESESDKCSLLQEYFSFIFKKGGNIAKVLSELENIAFKLESYNNKINDEMKISKFLSILPDEYKHFISAKC